MGWQPTAQPLPDGRVLLVGWGARWHPDGPDQNATIYGPDGRAELTACVGDGVAHVRATVDGSVWVGYDDMGIYGNNDWGLDGAPMQIGEPGLIRFSPNLEIEWEFPGPGTWGDSTDQVLRDRLAALPGPIDDCSALTLDGDTLWMYYYSSFPVVRIDGDGDVRAWPCAAAEDAVPVIVQALATDGDHVGLAGDSGKTYEDDRVVIAATRGRLEPDTQPQARPSGWFSSASRRVHGRSRRHDPRVRRHRVVSGPPPRPRLATAMPTNGSERSSRVIRPTRAQNGAGAQRGAARGRAVGALHGGAVAFCVTKLLGTGSMLAVVSVASVRPHGGFAQPWKASSMRTGRDHAGRSGTRPSMSTSTPTTTRTPRGGSAGQGVKPSVRTMTIDGRGRSATAASMPRPMSVPPPPASTTSRARLTRLHGVHVGVDGEHAQACRTVVRRGSGCPRPRRAPARGARRASIPTCRRPPRPEAPAGAASAAPPGMPRLRRREGRR